MYAALTTNARNSGPSGAKMSRTAYRSATVSPRTGPFTGESRRRGRACSRAQRARSPDGGRRSGALKATAPAGGRSPLRAAARSANRSLRPPSPGVVRAVPPPSSSAAGLHRRSSVRPANQDVSAPRLVLVQPNRQGGGPLARQRSEHGDLPDLRALVRRACLPAGHSRCGHVRLRRLRRGGASPASASRQRRACRRPARLEHPPCRGRRRRPARSGAPVQALGRSSSFARPCSKTYRTAPGRPLTPSLR